MALKEPQKLPNLKICVDNVDSESDDDNLSLTDEPQISIEEDTPEKNADTSANTEEGEDISDTGGHVEDVQFNVYLNKLVEPKPVDSTFIRPSKIYENKEGDFVTGIDYSNKVELDKREERAKRFGLQFKPQPMVDLDELYESLGIRLEDLTRNNERGIRLEAIHIRGVNDMNTKDVFNYFQEFAAGGCEWIDDESCNVVWMDKVTAARAMLKLSKGYEEVMVEYGLSVNRRKDGKATKDSKDKDSSNPEKPAEGDKKEEAAEDDQGQGRTEEKMDEDDDLDLTEENKAPAAEPEKKNDEEEKMDDDEGIEEGEIMDSDSEPEADRSENKADFHSIPWPPGKWRLGKPFQDRNQYMFLRYATKADVKLPGAERRSKFYQKFGNPNYGGMRGLISGTMKRKMRSFNKREESSLDDLETFGVSDDRVAAPVGNRDQISYEDDLFSDANVPDKVEELELYSESDRLAKPEKKLKHSDDEDEGEEEDDMRHMLDENDFPIVEKMEGGSDGEAGSESDVDEKELQMLLGKPPSKRPAMRMYADEIEQEQRAVRNRELVGALTVVSDAKKKKNRVKDARQLITGMRSALKEKTLNRDRDSPLGTLGMISVLRSESRSPSPVYEAKPAVKHMSPIHMTIENSPQDRSRSPSPEVEEEEEVIQKPPSPVALRSKSPVGLRTKSPVGFRTKSPVGFRSKSPVGFRSKSPVGFKTKMDEIEAPSVRSRLSKKTREDARNRLNRRSPNNVRSRLSERVPSPSPSPPPRSPDRRVPRMQKSRSPMDFRSKFRRSRSPFDRRHRRLASRSPVRRSPVRRFNRRSRSPIRRGLNRRDRSPFRRRFNRSRSRSPIRRQNNRSGFRSRSPLARRLGDRTRPGRDARSRLGRKSRSPTDTESDFEPETAPPARARRKAAGASSDSSSSSSSSSESGSDSSSSSESSSSSSSSSSESSSSDSESDSDASERNAIRNKKSQRRPAQEGRRNTASARMDIGRKSSASARMDSGRRNTSSARMDSGRRNTSSARMDSGRRNTSSARMDSERQRRGRREGRRDT